MTRLSQPASLRCGIVNQGRQLRRQPRSPGSLTRRARLTGVSLTGVSWRDRRLGEEAMPSRNTDPALLPAHVMSDEIGAGRLSPVDIVEAALARIAAEDGQLHAFVEVYDKEARLAAQAAAKTGR